MTTSSRPVGLGRAIERRRTTPAARLGSVVVTGASSGIGRATAEHLAALGYRVFAGVRDPRVAHDLTRVSPNIEPVLLDITRPGDIAELVELVRRTEPAGLTALVNNAGVGSVGPIETLDLDEWRAVLEVNLIGTVAVTQALLPSLLAARGRIVNISSAAGRVAFPLFGPYVASKFALEGVTDVLRREVEAHGVKVIAVELRARRCSRAGDARVANSRRQTGAPLRASAALCGKLRQCRRPTCP